MPSRRRSRNKNIGNNLAEVSRRLRTLERKPVRTKLGNRIVKTSSLAPNSVGADEVNFGTAVITSDPVVDNTYVENPKDGLFVVSSTTGATSVYSEADDNFYPLADPTAQADAAQAAEDAATAADAAEAAQLSANGKNAVFRQPTQPTATKVGDIWFNTNPGNGAAGDRPQRWTGTEWEFFGLNYAAISSIDANVITTGVLTGRDIQTSATGNRIIMTNTDELQFFNSANERVGTIGPFDFGATQEGLVMIGGLASQDAPRIMLNTYGDITNVHISADNFLSPSVILTKSSDESIQRININGGGATAVDGSVDILAGQGGLSLRSWTSGGGGADEISFINIYPGSGQIALISDRIAIQGNLLLYSAVEQGTGAPQNYTGADADANIGSVVFRYT